MSELPHCALDQHLVRFSRYLRAQGLNVGIRETMDVLSAMKTLSGPTEFNLRTTTRSLFCSSRADFEQFDRLFDSFWKGDSRRFSSQLKVSHGYSKKESPSSIIWMGQSGKGHETERQSKEISGANAQERLRRTDFSKISEIEAEMLEKLARKLWREMNFRLSRRWKEHQRKGQVNIRRTLRKSISAGGNPVKLLHKNRKLRKPRMVVFLDISGSMDKYSFYLLRFLNAIQENFDQVDTFLFSTRLHCITDIMKKKVWAKQQPELTERAAAWSSGTTMGKCLEEFNKKFAKFSLSRQSVVLILSDGLDTGETEVLQSELSKIGMRAKKLIWLNPLKGMEGYRPEARGMRSALPLVDVFSGAHNLESLLELEKHLQDV